MVWGRHPCFHSRLLIMIKLTNRAVQDNLYEILTLTCDPCIWTHGDYAGNHKLVIRNNETTTTSYPYKTKEALQADYKEIMRIKEALTI